MTDQLSPAAQTVWLTAWEHSPVNCESVEHRRRQQIAAALRALADQDETLFDVEDELVPAVRAVRTNRILAIAAELEARS